MRSVLVSPAFLAPLPVAAGAGPQQRRTDGHLGPVRQFEGMHFED
jgi:hypothetical protein